MTVESGTHAEVEGFGPVRVGHCLGEGGQGWVFEAYDTEGRPYALKWYKAAPPGQERTIAYLVERGAPSPRFLWPIGVARSTQQAGFGYLMPLRPPNFVGMANVVHGVDESGAPLDVSFAATITFCHQLARSFLRLHALGLCYRDINYGNLFFERDTGVPLICDNDNVGVDGSPGGVLGAQGFMAPEVVRCLAGPGAPGSALPSARTDLHSLAVTLFLVLFLAHPLEGAKTETGIVDVDWQLTHFGLDPVFAFDPLDDRNRPVDDVAPTYWRAYPGFLRELFITAFTDGLRDPDLRVRESQWARALLALRDAMTACDSCGGTIFHDPDDPERPCVRCGAGQAPPTVLELGPRRVVLAPGARLFTDHLGGSQDDVQPVAEVAGHPRDPGRQGLRNLTAAPWTAVTPDGKLHEVGPGRAIETAEGTRIRFGPTEGLVSR